MVKQKKNGHVIFTQSGTPLETIWNYISAILNLTAPKHSKQRSSFLGSVHYLFKLKLNLSQLCHPLRPLVKKNSKFIWHNELETHFQNIKKKLANATESTHYNPHLEIQFKCDSSRTGLGAALEQRSPTGWHTLAFASRFLNSYEER